MNRLRALLLVDLARAVYDCFDCLDECEESGGTLGYVRGRPCADCDCWKCVAARALRAHQTKAPNRKAGPAERPRRKR